MNQSGFSVVELMVAMLLSMTLGIAVVSVFVNNSHSFNQDENLSRMQDDARFALREIAFDISMAGNYGVLHIPANVTPDPNLAIGIDCGPAGEVNWMYRTIDAATTESLSITAVDNATAASAVAEHSCITGGELREGTDVVSIKRVAGAEAGALNNGSVYMRTNGTVGLMFRAPFPAAPAVPIAAPSSDWEFRPSIYYVRQFANNPGDGIPTLCRKVLRGVGPTMTTECLATGIENLQIEYGIDTSEDGHPNMYTTNPTLTEIQDVVSARIFLLARTTEIDTRYTNDKTYSISNAADYAPGDSFHRRVFSTSVSIQNIRSLNMMGY
ncbi:MAG: PilW family protein [Woeseiaceae bacterium]